MAANDPVADIAAAVQLPLADGGVANMSPHFALLAASALAGQQPPRQPAPSTLLVIELPDGVRGGIGRIKGNGRRPTNKDEPFFIHLLTVARQCGANFPMLATNFSHSSHIVSWSTTNDREVVLCLRSKMPTHFNAGLAEPDVTRGFTVPDTAPFREFESAGIRR
jgi:hypothetical protein